MTLVVASTITIVPIWIVLDRMPKTMITSTTAITESGDVATKPIPIRPNK